MYNVVFKLQCTTQYTQYNLYFIDYCNKLYLERSISRNRELYIPKHKAQLSPLDPSPFHTYAPFSPLCLSHPYSSPRSKKTRKRLETCSLSTGLSWRIWRWICQPRGPLWWEGRVRSRWWGNRYTFNWVSSTQTLSTGCHWSNGVWLYNHSSTNLFTYSQNSDKQTFFSLENKHFFTITYERTIVE